MVIKTLTPRAIWSYQAYSTTTCSSQWIPFIAECILPGFFVFFVFLLAQTAREHFFCLGIWCFVFCRFCCPPTNTTPTIFSDWAFTIYNSSCQLSCHGESVLPCCNNLFFYSDWTGVWFPNSQTLGDLGENWPCNGNCTVPYLKDLDCWTSNFVGHYSIDICLLWERCIPLPLTMNKYKFVLQGLAWYLDLVTVQKIQWCWPQRKPTAAEYFLQQQRKHGGPVIILSVIKSIFLHHL